jgi:hypothetical protein
MILMKQQQHIEYENLENDPKWTRGHRIVVPLVVASFLSGLIIETTLTSKYAYNNADERHTLNIIATTPHQHHPKNSRLRRRECELPLPSSVSSATFYPKRFTRVWETILGIL